MNTFKLSILIFLVAQLFGSSSAKQRLNPSQIPTKGVAVNNTALTQKLKFLAYTAKFSKQYTSQTDITTRFQNWIATDNFIKNFSSQTITLQHNQFSDWSQEERNLLLNTQLQNQYDVAQNKSAVILWQTNTTLPITGNCPLGFRLSGSLCFLCPPGCQTCLNSTYCLTCWNDNFTLSDEGSCQCISGPIASNGYSCESCIYGLVYNKKTNQCQNCDIRNCEYCSQDNNVCFSCFQNLTLVNNSCICTDNITPQKNCVKCNLTQYFDGNDCQECQQNCSSCSSPSGLCKSCKPTLQLNSNRTCTCPPNTYLESTNFTCVPLISCPSGNYNLGNNTCVPCGFLCQSCNNGSLCLNCSDQSLQIVQPNDNQNCNECDFQFKNVPVGQCRCRPSSILNGTSCQQLLSCPVGYYNPGDDTCKRCKSILCEICGDFQGFCKKTIDPSILIYQTTGIPYCPQTAFLEKNQRCKPLINCGPGLFNNGSNFCKYCPDPKAAICANFTGQSLKCYFSFTLLDNSTCSCLSTQYLDIGTPKNSQLCVDLVKCRDGFYNPGWNNCTKCVPYCQQCSDEDGVCIQCLPAFTLNNNQCSCNPDPKKQYFNATNQSCVDVINCGAGQYNPGYNNCTLCPENCTQCSDFIGDCSLCQPTYTLDPVTQRCRCSPGSYQNDLKNCQNCPANCTLCQDQTAQCMACSTTFTLNNLTGGCSCAFGEYLNVDGTCQQCPDNCTSCSDFTAICLTCKDQFSYDQTLGSCSCALGTYLKVTNIQENAQYKNVNFDENILNAPSSTQLSLLASNQVRSCIKCPQNCSSCQDETGNCQTCSLTFSLNQSLACSCAFGTYLTQSDSNRFCSQCPPNCTSCSDFTGICLTCNPTFTLSQDQLSCVCSNTQYLLQVGSNSICQYCPQNCTTCEDLTGNCLTCHNTFQLVSHSDNTVSCQCAQGTYWNSQINQCLQCPANCSTCADNTGDCLTCLDTFVLSGTTCQCSSENGAQILIDGACYLLSACPTGYYNPGNNICLAGPANCERVANFTGVCQKCKETFSYQMQNNTCSCGSTQYYDSFSELCGQCPQNCSTCLNQYQCTSCQPTFQLDSYSFQCQCPQAFPTLYRNTCNKLCPSGQFSVGNNICLNCAKNCLQCQIGSGICQACVPTFSLVQLGTNSTCLCNQSQFYGGVYCQPCPNNCTSCSDFTGQCTTCAPSFTLIQGQCTCTSNQILVNGSTCSQTINCGLQYYNNGQNICLPCPDTYCSQCSDISGACNICLPTFTQNQIKNVCECNSTQYQVLLVSDTSLTIQGAACLSCNIQNCFSCANQTGHCTQCAATFTLDKALNLCLCKSNQVLLFNQCFDCTSNCISCSNLTYCDTCDSNYINVGGVCIPAQRLLQGSKFCQGFPVGPVGNPTLCLTSEYSNTRIVPQFDESMTYVDWRAFSVVGNVQDQGKCVSNYAFTTNGAAQSAYAIKTGLLYELSAQFIIECDSSSQGCEGGYPTTANILLASVGAVQADDYPYIAKRTSCKLNMVKPLFLLKFPGYQQIESSKNTLKQALLIKPVIVSLRISNSAFFFYSSGIFTQELCDLGNLNHSMLAIGFGLTQDGKTEFVILQNSWAKTWGESGYLRLQLTDDSVGACGIYLQNSVSLI